MKKLETAPPKYPCAEYISDGGKIRLIQTPPGTRYMAEINVCNMRLVEFGETPQRALANLRKATHRLELELCAVTLNCREEEIRFTRGER